jgi:hypothetical protein
MVERMLRGSRWALLLGTVLAFSGPAIAVARPRSHAKVVRLSFNRIPGGRVVSNGQYTFVRHIDGSGTLIDEQTGVQKTIVPPSSCASGTPVIGGPWLVWECALADAQTFDLYSLSDPTSEKSVPMSAGISSACDTNQPTDVACGPVAVGSQWIETMAGCYHCAPIVLYQNLVTGDAKPFSPQPGAVIDLNAPSLERRSCLAATLSTGDLAYATGGIGLIYNPSIHGTYYAQKCHQARGPLLNHDLGMLGEDNAGIARSKSLIVYSSPRYGALTLAGIATRTGENLEIGYPAKIKYPSGLALGDRTLYMTNGDVAWAARLPRTLWASGSF